MSLREYLCFLGEDEAVESKKEKKVKGRIQKGIKMEKIQRSGVNYSVKNK